MCPRRGTFFSCLAKKRRQKKATPSLRPLRVAKGQTCAGALAGRAVELATRWRAALEQPRRVSLRKHARSDAHATPQPPRRRRSHKGFEAPTGHRCARPREASALCAASARPSAAMARVAVRWVPFWPCQEAQRRGWACVPQDTHASSTDSPWLFERSAPARSEFHGAPPARASQVAPTHSVGDTDSRVAFLLLTFLWRSKEK